MTSPRSSLYNSEVQLPRFLESANTYQPNVISGWNALTFNDIGYIPYLRIKRRNIGHFIFEEVKI